MHMEQNNWINNEMDEDEIVIDLTEVLGIVMSKIHLVILAGILAALLTFAGTKLFITPMYASVTKIYVLSKQDSSTAATYSDLQAGTYLTKDYMELVKSSPVLEQVIAVLNLDMEPETLADRIDVETPEDTRVVRIIARDEDPKMAKEIADAVRDSVSIQITEIMGADAVNTVEEGTLPASPESPDLKKNVAIGGIIGIFLALAVIVLAYIRDDTVKKPEDVEKQLGMTVLGIIPVQESYKKSGKRMAKKSRRQ